MAVCPAGTIFRGPDNQAFKCVVTIRSGEVIESYHFKPLTPETPVPRSGEEIPIWFWEQLWAHAQEQEP